MNIKSIIETEAEAKGISYEEAEKEFYEWDTDVRKHLNDGWNTVIFPPTKVSNVGKSNILRIILKDGSEIEGYYSPICGYSTTSSFYSEHLINKDDVKYWKYKD